MHRIIRMSFVVSGLTLLSACASLPPYQTAKQVSLTNQYLIGPAPVKIDYMHQFIDTRNSVLYMQNQGGGGATVGLLFGPIGVMANMEMIKKQTESDASSLQNKLPIDVQKLFDESFVDGKNFTTAHTGSSAPTLSPVFYVEKTDASHIHFASMIYVAESLGGKEWHRQYVYELPESYTHDALVHGLTKEQMDQLSADAETGFQWIASTYASDIAGTFNPTQRRAIHSDFVTPRTQIAFYGYSFDAGSSRIGWAMVQPSGGVIYSLPKDAATLTN